MGKIKMTRRALTLIAHWEIIGGMKSLHDWLTESRGRTKALAEHLRLPASMVSKMASGEKKIPLDHCPYIEAFTGGEVPCEIQRPDKAAYFAMLKQRGVQEVVVSPANVEGAHA